jgi:hypothetical protein
MKKVFRMSLDGDKYQFFTTDSLEDERKLRLDGSSIADTWTPPPVFILYPKHRAGAFYNSNPSNLIATPQAVELLYSHFSFSGELLPLPYKGQTFTLLNVTQCIDVLDHDRTEFRIAPSGLAVGIERFAFHANRFVETSLFKIPEFKGGEIFVLEGANDFHLEFREAVSAYGLEGLRFTEIWSEEG